MLEAPEPPPTDPRYKSPLEVAEVLSPNPLPPQQSSKLLRSIQTSESRHSGGRVKLLRKNLLQPPVLLPSPQYHRLRPHPERDPTPMKWPLHTLGESSGQAKEPQLRPAPFPIPPSDTTLPHLQNAHGRPSPEQVTQSFLPPLPIIFFRHRPTRTPLSSAPLPHA